jgi:hypothetical protein
VTAAIFDVLAPDRFLPTELARGPWDPGALHGGPVAALAARAAEQLTQGAGLALTRLTVDLLRPVPLTPLRVAPAVTRAGRKVQLIGVDIGTDDGTVVARASALLVRTAPLAMPEGLEYPAVPPGPDAGRPPGPFAGVADVVAFHRDGVELRFVKGDFGEPGPAHVWIRLLAPLVAGEETSPAVRAVALADFGNGVSSVLPWELYRFVNADLTVSLSRPPAGEWVCLDAHTYPGPDGIGLGESALFDAGGFIGRATQSLLLEARDPGPG